MFTSETSELPEDSSEKPSSQTFVGSESPSDPGDQGAVLTMALLRENQSIYGTYMSSYEAKTSDLQQLIKITDSCCGVRRL